MKSSSFFLKIPSQNFVQEIKDTPTSKNILNFHFFTGVLVPKFPLFGQKNENFSRFFSFCLQKTNLN